MPVRWAVFVAAVLLAAIATRPPAWAADGPSGFRSVDVDLPFGDLAFPPGPGADAVTGNCLACHSAEMILNQPPLSRAAWQVEVDKMRAAYAAPVDDEDARSIVDYLAHIKGSD
jgi:mono/diheme cytochrome c family protein